MDEGEQDLKEVVVEFAGSRYRAFIEAGSGLLVCPLCRKGRFATPEDLAAHIVAHAKGLLDKRREPPQRIHESKGSSEE